MSELIARLERAFFALTNPPAPPALPAPDRQPEIDELRADLTQAREGRGQDLARLGQMKKALEVETAECEQLRAEIETLRARCASLESDALAAKQAATPDDAAIGAAVDATLDEVGGSLRDFVARERVEEFATRLLGRLLGAAGNTEETIDANPNV